MTCYLVDFVVAANSRIKIKESKKIYKCLDLAKELKKLPNIKVAVVPIVIGVLGTISKGLIRGLEELEIEGRDEAIQPTALLRSAIILRRIPEIS